jgi:hypothetical protein
MLTTLDKAVAKSGLKIVELDGWRTRKSNGGEDYGGILVHHTGAYDAIADAADDLAYAKWMALTGRGSALPPPLANLALSAECVVYVSAAGNANHAGQAKASGPMPAASDGSRIYIGIEAMNSGSQGWGSKGKDASGATITQYDAYVRLCAALCLHYNWPASHVRAHKETSVTGKWDPGMIDMDKFRAAVAAEMKAMKAKEPTVTAKPQDPFRVITWNVYAGSRVKALEPHLIREREAGLSVALVQEAMVKDLDHMFWEHGMGYFAFGQYAVAWDTKDWPHLLRERGYALSKNTYYHFGKGKQITTDCAEVILSSARGRTLTALSYHTPAKVQSRDMRPARVAERVAVTFEAHEKIGRVARNARTCGFLAGGDDNWDEDTGNQSPEDKVRDILLGGKTGLMQLQAGKPTFGKREIDDFRILRNGLLVPVGEPWVAEGGGEEKPNHKIHGRTLGWKK